MSSSCRPPVRRHPAAEVFAAFLQLGLTSFGGPIAHLGYFHRELVAKRQWIDEKQYGQLLALCQFLPGPASSQLGFALGLIRAGWLGGIAAFVAFTLPSAVLLVAFASASTHLSGPIGQSAIHGLKLVAVAVVADGVRRMARQLTPDAPRALLAAAAAAVILVTDLPIIQLIVVAMGAVLGQWLCRSSKPVEGASFPLRYGARVGAVLLVVFCVLLAGAVAIVPGASPTPGAVAAAFYRAGALVFGGGHVVLPLLQDTVVEPGWIDNDTFLAGYGAAQAIPGPMFTFAAYLGEQLGDVALASISLIAIFLPGLLLVAGVLPSWRSIGRHPAAARALAGVNATVVGLLAAALYDPVWISAVAGPWDFATVLIATVTLSATRISTVWIVALCVLTSVARALSS